MKSSGVGRVSQPGWKRKCAEANTLGPDKRRSLNELAAAIVFLDCIEEDAKNDPDGDTGKLISKVAQKGRQMLEWAAGEDNTFGDIIRRFMER